MREPAQVSPRMQVILRLDECIAKTVKLANGATIKGVNVSTHCQTVGRVAQELIRRQPEWLKKAFSPPCSELVPATHDVGKISPHFQEKIYSAAGTPLGIGNATLDSTLGGHAAVSQACLKGVTHKFIPEILGRHHGASPNSLGCPNDENYGGVQWQKIRMDLVDDLKRFFKCEWPIVTNENHANVLSGLTCVADWIASGTLFDGVDADGNPNGIPWESLVSEAVNKAGFVGFKIRPGLTFQDIFSFQPREAQVKFIQAADRQGVYVLEAPMGMGKTEAALYAAYNMLQQGMATGVYFALPTQLTSDKIYDRMNDFLSKVLAEDCKFRSLLLHSSAWLRDTELGEEGMPGNGWFNSSKRGLLAPFAVGTIDQALMGVLNVKHGFVRAFGLAGKVVILDEVHSYDSFTGTILDKLVETLRELQCTVIILSATLTAERRSELLGEKNTESAYPLISSSPKNGPAFSLPVAQTDSSTVIVQVKNNDPEAIEEALLRAEQGEQVLWIENVVAEAQERFRQLAARAQACDTKIECGLLHSRFLRIDRKINEEKWVKCFGKTGYENRKVCGRILIGTQVLEQSLDIDADFLVTRICPTDMLFQRIGRLWRHREADAIRPKTAQREAWILAPDLEESRENITAWGKTGKVYMPYILYRSLEVWQNAMQVILPQDIRPLLESTYVNRDETGLLNGNKNSVKETREKLKSFARIGLSTIGRQLPDTQIKTRYSETESNEVLLIHNKITTEHETIITLLNGKVLRLEKNIRSKNPSEWRRIAAELQQNIVMVPKYATPGTQINQIEWLKEFVYLGDESESFFHVTCVQEDGTLTGVDGGNVLSKYSLTYTNEIGYTVIKINTSDTPEDPW